MRLTNFVLWPSQCPLLLHGQQTVGRGPHPFELNALPLVPRAVAQASVSCTSTLPSGESGERRLLRLACLRLGVWLHRSSAGVMAVAPREQQEQQPTFSEAVAFRDRRLCVRSC
jgi:hypothetical protein